MCLVFALLWGRDEDFAESWRLFGGAKLSDEIRIQPELDGEFVVVRIVAGKENFVKLCVLKL